MDNTQSKPIDSTNSGSESSPTSSSANGVFSSSESSKNTMTSIEQDGVLMVNVSEINLIAPDAILTLNNKQRNEKEPTGPKDLDEIIGKIQSNSREIMGDTNGNIHKSKETTTVPAKSIESTSEAEQTRTGNTTEPTPRTKRHRRTRHGGKRNR